ncbi:MAG: hypothetical protein C0169_07770 [Thermodesulfobacterium geofontis]|uniref:Uncharacterized protein n=1 Tax=Thermodesulfobacterium geofontis TaxID=1295609 RepID=A0A2N7Q5X3_9BACT|nr:MAG: hypothetical protein C0169_07770 [Thermodesulfobacterium geofontis]
MSFFAKLFKKKKENKKEFFDKGILIFENTSEVIRAEGILKEKGIKVKVVGPPPEVRRGCDLAIEIPIVESMGIIKILKTYKLEPLDFIPYNKGQKLLKPVNIFNIKDFGKYLMVRAANMKITVDKDTLTIVNISGGGCPDVPFLASKLIGLNLKDAPQPKELGHTLCGYALQLAFDKVKELLCFS